MLEAREGAGASPVMQVTEELRSVILYLSTRRQPTTALFCEFDKAIEAASSAPATPSTLQVLTLTRDQSEAIEGILANIAEPDACPVLCGYAGTGKTVTTAALVSRLVDAEKRVVVATPTHKARAQVERALNDRGAHGFEVVTIHRLLGLKQVRDRDTGRESFAPDPKGKNMLTQQDRWDEELCRTVPVTPIDVVIVDETSMVGSDLYDMLKRELQGRPVVFVGDDRQLLPVGEEQACRAFTEGSEVYRLMEVLRHDGAILNLATSTRELPVGRARFASAEGGGTRVVACRSREDWGRTLLEMAASEEAMRDPDFCRALAFTNKAVDEWNLRIHHRRYGADAPQFVEGMTCVTVDAIPNPDGSGPLLNSTVDVMIEEATREAKRFPGDLVTEAPWQCWKVTVSVAGDGLAPVTFNVLAAEERERWGKVMNDIAKDAKTANGKARSQLWDTYFQRKDCIGSLQPASALTIHKSQGSTFQNVWLHWSIDGWGSAPTAQQNQLAYVGITRSARELHVVGDR
jgi:exodeoxyribonuclease-5